MGVGFVIESDDVTAADVVGIIGVFLSSWVLGDNMRVRRAYVAAVEDRAAQLEREQDAQAQRAVLERTRELGLLRAVGMSRRQLRSVIRWESVIIALFGAVLGLTVGVLGSWGIVTASGDEGPEVFQVPVGTRCCWRSWQAASA